MLGKLGFYVMKLFTLVEPKFKKLMHNDFATHIIKDIERYFCTWVASDGRGIANG